MLTPKVVWPLTRLLTLAALLAVLLGTTYFSTPARAWPVCCSTCDYAAGECFGNCDNALFSLDIPWSREQVNAYIHCMETCQAGYENCSDGCITDPCS